MLKVIEKIGANNVRAIVTDQGSNMKYAREKVREKIPHIIEVRCHAHFTNLLMQGIFKMTHIRDTFNKAKDVVAFIKSRPALKCRPD